MRYGWRVAFFRFGILGVLWSIAWYTCFRDSPAEKSDVFAVCLDIGGKYAGATVGAMNTAAMLGGFISSVVFGYQVNHFGNYTAPFIAMAIFLVAGTLLWLAIDPTQPLVPDAVLPNQPELSIL